MTYRVYCIDGAGYLRDPKWFDALCDDDVIAQIRVRCRNDSKCEIWQGKRLVASISPSSLWA